MNKIRILFTGVPAYSQQWETVGPPEFPDPHSRRSNPAWPTHMIYPNVYYFSDLHTI